MNSLKYYGLAGAILIAGTMAEATPPGDKPRSNTRPRDARPSDARLRDVLLRMSMEHPRIQAKARELTAALKRAKFRAWTYPDPRIGVFFVNGPYKRDLRFIRDQTPMTGVEYRLTQAIPFPGRLTIASKIADQDANIRRLELALEKNRVAGEFLELLVLTRATGRTLKLAEAYAERMTVVADAARTRYSVGRGNLADVSRADLRSQAYRDRILELRGEYQALLPRLGYYAGKPPRRLLEPGPIASYLGKLEREIPRDAKSLAARSPAIALTKTRVKRAQERRTLTKMKYLPDFEVFAAYRRRAFIENDPAQGENFMSMGLTVRVPLWSALSNSHALESRVARAKAAQFAAQDAIVRERTLFRALQARRRGDLRRLELYAKRLIPAAARARDSARLAYETGKVDFDVFLNSWDTLYMLEADRIRLEASARRRLLRQAVIFNEILPRSGGPK